MLGYDLNIQTGVILSLAHSLINKHSNMGADWIWAKVRDEVQSANQNAGTITLDSISDELKSAFKNKHTDTIPAAFVNAPKILILQNWNNLNYAEELTWTIVIGSWYDKNIGDLEAIRELTNIEYNQWVAKSRLILQEPQCPITLNNGIWRVVKRAELWQAIGNRLFDQHLESCKQLAINVLRERDPKFELPADDRFAASIYGKNLKYSESLRKGIAETLA